MTTARDLAAMSRRELAGVLRAGHAIDPRELDDTEYRGTSLGLPGIVERLTWKTFRKVFHRDPESGQLRGWNVRLEQHGIDGPSVPMRGRDGAPVTFGHYRVVELAGRPMPIACEKGLLLDYGLGENRALDPVGLVRDPLVAVERDRADLLLGWSYVEAGPLRFGTPSFFTLEREGPLTHRVPPPARARSRR